MPGHRRRTDPRPRRALDEAGTLLLQLGDPAETLAVPALGPVSLIQTRWASQNTFAVLRPKTAPRRLAAFLQEHTVHSAAETEDL